MHVNGVAERKLALILLASIGCVYSVCGWASSAKAEDCWQSSYDQKVYTSSGLNEFAKSQKEDLLSPKSEPNIRYVRDHKFTRVLCPTDTFGSAYSPYVTYRTGPVTLIAARELHGPELYFSDHSTGGLELEGGLAGGTTKFFGPDDKLTIKYSSPQIQIGGQANIGSWFVNGQAALSVAPSGSSNDVFTGGGVVSGNINTGMMQSLTVQGGYNVFQTSTTRVGVFAEGYTSGAGLYGTFGGAATQMPILVDRWNAGGAGVRVEHIFMVGSVPFVASGKIAGLFDNFQSGALNLNGGGVQANAALSFPIFGPLGGIISGGYTGLNASGNTVGVPMRVNTQDFWVSGGIQYDLNLRF